MTSQNFTRSMTMLNKYRTQVAEHIFWTCRAGALSRLGKLALILLVRLWESGYLDDLRSHSYP